MKDLDLLVAEVVLGWKVLKYEEELIAHKPDMTCQIMKELPRWSSDIAEAMQILDHMRVLGYRWLISVDEVGFHLRNVVFLQHDLDADEKTYTVDRPLGTAKTLSALPKVICEAAVREASVAAHESTQR